MSKVSKKQCVILLHNIRSVYNVGAIFRTADALGVSRIILSGYTPTPFDRFKNPRKDFIKCSLGAEKTVSWEYVRAPFKVLGKLKEDGFSIVSVEQDTASVDYKKYKPSQKTIIVFGNEVGGVSKKILTMSDSIIEIPMNGKKESLNVSVSAGIVLFRLFDRK